jgi:SAM-dependent methyltransferase
MSVASWATAPISLEVNKMLHKIPGPDKEGREAMYYAERQDVAYQQGAYDYLHSIAMVPRMATIAAYIKAFGVTRVLDVGCGTGDLLAYLTPDVAYVGVDIAPTAIHQARERFAQRQNASFYMADFRHWTCPLSDVDGVVWAGIGCTWTHKGRGGSSRDWLDILALAERPLRVDGYLLFELVTAHWPALERLIEGRYAYETGCDIDCFQSAESPKRSIRVLKKKVTTLAS